MIIGLSGFRGSGKDTVAAYLMKKHGFERKAFADPLKASVAMLLDIPFSEVDKLKNDTTTGIAIGRQDSQNNLVPHSVMRSMTFREFLQRYGTESHRDVFGHDFWLEYTLPSNGHYSGNKIAVSDVRFANEAQRIRELGGFIWFIHRFTDREAIDPHASEHLGFRVDVKVDNTGTIDDLHVEIERALSVSIPK